ncbi:hypothetical protein P7228_11815 [Altererythrobacter arenosus]|uniref:PepSY domain-containing protein n=1 Tax=Altererythrobacter arenosus TaxID=3032592 RepID=A0ABY8FNT3_9SPHN|nr:hypothetical protein [Altererythrobacter sp. CAU 1644]WFL76680.1 hypothetical protein P7228_11815 [Altererythrobacter sp. CAU 1644]
MARVNTFAAWSGMAAAISMAATPALAADIPQATPSSTSTAIGVFDADGVNADNHRWYRHRRHNRVDAGDVLAGVLIIGGIAAVASAASKNSRDRRYRDRDYRYRDYRDSDYRYRDRPYDYRERRGDSRYNAGRGIDNAVEMCVSRIERDARVDTVDEVERDGEGWRVSGTLYNGERFKCEIDSRGRIEDVDFGGFAAREDKQWDDDRYRAAWNDRNNGRIAEPQQADEAQPAPAYPGGPIEGETGDDGRYDTANAPDFGA